VRGGARVTGAVPDGETLDGKQRKLMSRPAELAALALRRLLRDAGWSAPRDAGLFLGVGASGGAVDELAALIDASREGDTLSPARLGREGLAACTPLLAFQLMNNFTLCHGAIQEGLAGPNAAFFSRGAGTVLALCEALAALDEGDCERAVAGAADSALHPVTWAELTREGRAARPPSEAAALLALSAAPHGALAVIEEATPRSAAVDGAHVVLRPADVAAALGESLAAIPALAWCAAVDLIAGGAARRVAVAGDALDGDAGVVVFGAPP